MTRMVRLLRTMPEVIILVRSMVAAMRSLFFTFCLLVGMLYSFAITFRHIAGGNAVLSQLYFHSVPDTMYNLMVHGTFLDNLSTVAANIGEQNRVALVIFWIFVLLSAMMVMNMLIGILCEVVSAVSASEREAVLVSFVKDKMQHLFAELDVNDNGLITREEFLQILEKREVCLLLQDVGVDVVGLVDQVDYIFEPDSFAGESGERQLDFPELMELILSLRGSCSAKVKDIIDLRKFVSSVARATDTSLQDMSKRLDSFQGTSAFPCGSRLPRTPRPLIVGDRGALHQDNPENLDSFAEGLEGRMQSLCAAIGKLEDEVAEVRRWNARVKGSLTTREHED